MIKKITLRPLFLLTILISTSLAWSQVTLETEVKISDDVMYMNGNKVGLNDTSNNPNGFDYAYGRSLTPHGDCVKTFGKYVFLTWYKGGEEHRNVMLTRYNTKTGSMVTIEFPHRHTGYLDRWWIGNTHNTIAVGISPKDGTIHMVYDMHRNGNIAAFANDYLRYSYSKKNGATVPDNEFTLDLFVPSNNDYKHLAFPGINDVNTTRLLTYPAFFTNDEGDLFMKNRFGYSRNGKFLWAKYDGNDWQGYNDFNYTSAQNHGSQFSWGLYGDIKYVNGKIRIGFQRRSGDRNDKYLYQNGMYYAYSDDPSGLTQWKDHLGNGFSRPLGDADRIKIYEPGDLVTTTKKDQVYIVNGFDWTVTENEDVHFIGKVRDTENSKTVYHHTYKPAGATEFITSTDFSGAETIYAAGNNIYMIGLNGSGRPLIRQALGGTNQFTKVYEQTSGKRFEKGELFIYEGKVYYYLLENNSANNDDSRTTYLQIIDLNIQEVPTPFAVNLVSPSNNQSFDEGETIQLFATASADEDEITKVQFLVDNTIINEDTVAPYSFDWTPSALGSYTIKAVAFKTGGASITSSEATIEVIEVDKSDLTGDIYRLRNVATGKILGDEGGSANPVSMNDSGEEQNKHWRFVKSGNFYNIDSETNGILRATGSAFAAGAYLVVSTGKAAPAGDSDKIWKLHYNELENTFRFEAGTNGRFLYHDVNGNVYTKDVEDSDLRSSWEAVSTSQSLSTQDFNGILSQVKVYPNPAQDEFTIAIQNTQGATIEIFNILGALVHKESTNNNEIVIQKRQLRNSGMYLIKVSTADNKINYSKILMR